ncbi:hypothetical protein [Nocardioides sp. zg-1228]|uniref:hypothetical protein n=1 Tax=Nocardioides sp. zg-1228 TaxID=2763008 RepID=UPI001642B431|nr:hypothetical protein [Nocardioides sp. zg-1228]MBC2934427.1 hypothetical protein [Nocardioides sp. zg-1228]QSF59192.1 hypothetical protein JX575_08560 [Nocardioides sp. zg-1228]
MGARGDRATARTRSLLWPGAWATALAVLLLGGALGPGYVLSYDMVWVPDLRLGADALGLGTALPRAVPSDAVVAVLDEVLGGMLLQKLVLLLPLVAAGTGAAALVGPGVVARLVAVSVAVWNPFVVERLAIGHWPVLVGYGVLPWVLLAGTAWRRSGVMPARLPVLLLLGSLSASTGLVTAFAACVSAARRRRDRWLALAGLVVLANLPWVVSGLLHAGSATSSAAGADVFAPSGEGMLPAPLTFLSLGGIWNAAVVPDSRTGPLAVAMALVLVALAVLGVRRGWSKVPQGPRRALVWCWAVGLGLTLAAWALPGVTGWLASTVPGAGVLRDGSRLLALAAPLTAVLAGRGAEALVRLLPDALSRAMIALACVLVPVALMPDPALGLSGRVSAVDYPASYDALVDELRALPEGTVAVLPFQSYRAPAWNNDARPVLAPLGRYLPGRVVVEDRLVVDGRALAGEDPSAADVRRALAAPDPGQRAARLREAGVRYVVVERLPGVEVPEVAGEEVGELDDLTLVDVGPGRPPSGVPAAWTVVMALAWTGWCGLPVLALFLAVWRRRRAGRIVAQ